MFEGGREGGREGNNRDIVAGEYTRSVSRRKRERGGEAVERTCWTFYTFEREREKYN